MTVVQEQLAELLTEEQTPAVVEQVAELLEELGVPEQKAEQVAEQLLQEPLNQQQAEEVAQKVEELPPEELVQQAEQIAAPEEGIKEEEPEQKQEVSDDECVNAENILDAIKSIKDKINDLINTLNKHFDMVKGFEDEEGKSDEQTESVYNREDKIKKDYLVTVEGIAETLADINDKIANNEGNCENIKQQAQEVQQTFLQLKNKLI
jgi:Mg2+ and Co2+ transporter CorA